MKKYMLITTYQAVHSDGIRDTIDNFEAESYEDAMKRVEEISYFWDFNRILHAKLFEGEMYGVNTLELRKKQEHKQKELYQ